MHRSNTRSRLAPAPRWRRVAVAALFWALLLALPASIHAQDGDWGFGAGDAAATSELDVLSGAWGRPARGPADAPVTVVVFSDFECPFCKRVTTTLELVHAKYPDDVRIVFRHYPLAFHSNARQAAEVAEAAHAQGRFWDIHDILFAAPEGLSPELLERLPHGVELDDALYEQDLASDRVRDAVDADMAWGKKLGVNGTPHFFVNGLPINGAVGVDVFEEAIELELLKARHLDAAVTDELPDDLSTAAQLTLLNRAAMASADQSPTLSLLDDAGAITLGPDDAVLTLTAFVRWTDPMAAEVLETADRLRQLYGRDLRVVLRSLPQPVLPVDAWLGAVVRAAHSTGVLDTTAPCLLDLAAKGDLASCAGGNPDDDCVEDLERTRATVRAGLDACGLDGDAILAAVDPEWRDAAEHDRLMATQAIGARTIPALFINGQRLASLDDPPDVIAQVEEHYTKAKRIAEAVPRTAIPKLLASGALDEARVDPRAEGRPSIGPNDAAVTIVELTDYECPFCAKANKTIGTLLERYPDDLRLVAVNLPLSFHQNARDAARAAWAAAQQSDAAFERVRNALFEQQKDLGEETYRAIGQALAEDSAIAFDPDRFETDRKSEASADAVDADLALAKTLGVKGTPHFFVNGRPVRGARPIEDFTTIIEAELALADVLAAHDTTAAELAAALAGEDGEAETGPVENERKHVRIGNRPARGDDDALVTIVEFSDFQCPFCARVQPTLDDVMQQYSGQVRLVFAHNPLQFHKRAEPAARAAWAAHQQGRFADYEAKLFANQKQLDRSDLRAYAEELGLDMKQFGADMTSDAARRAVESDRELAGALGLTGTPSFLINGRALTGAQPLARFETVIDEEIAAAQALIDDGVPPERVYDRLTGADMFEGRDDVRVRVKGAPTVGKRRASHQVALFVDPGHPSAVAALETFAALMQQRGDATSAAREDVELVLVPVTFSDEASAQELVQAVWTAADDNDVQTAVSVGKAVARSAGDGDPATVAAHLERAGVDIDALDADSRRLQRGLDAAENLAIRGTPVFVIDGVPVREPWPADTIAAWVGLR